MSDLYLNLKGEYFDDIKAGTKPFEYRLDNEYWRKRLVGRHYGMMIIRKGYPPKNDRERMFILPYRGYEMQTITHKHFGPEPVRVFAIYTTARKPVDLINTPPQPTNRSE